MQVQNVNSVQNNTPNFQGIKSIRCEGLYKKYPELAKDLVDTFKKNPTTMDFCKKYDVDVVFHAMKQMQNSVESSVHIFFDNISKSKARKFFDKLAGNSEDKVVIHAWGNDYSLPHSMEESTAQLKIAISPEKKSGSFYYGGLLDSHIKSADEKIQKALSEKSKKVLEKQAKLDAAKASETKLKKGRSELQDSIDDLLKMGNDNK